MRVLVKVFQDPQGNWTFSLAGGAIVLILVLYLLFTRL